VTTTLPAPSEPARSFTPTKSSVPRLAKSIIMAIRNPKSPIRFTMNAFFPASAFAFSLNQKPISR
jgi:hypothetical protein